MLRQIIWRKPNGISWLLSLKGDRIIRSTHLQDVGCPDFEAARRNRERIANPPQEELQWWRWYEHLLQVTPHNKPLPPDAPQ